MARSIAKQKEWVKNNRERVLLAQRRWRENNPEAVKASAKKYDDKTREEKSLKTKQRRKDNIDIFRERERKWREANKPSICAKAAKRRSLQLNATTGWSEMADISLLYELRDWNSKVDGITYHVDHVIPLVNDLVCGLHVLDNLRIIPASDNVKKSNTFSLSEENF